MSVFDPLGLARHHRCEENTTSYLEAGHRLGRRGTGRRLQRLEYLARAPAGPEETRHSTVLPRLYTRSEKGAAYHAAPRRATTSNPTSECSGPTREQSLHGSKRGRERISRSWLTGSPRSKKKRRQRNGAGCLQHITADDATREPPADFDQTHRWFPVPSSCDIPRRVASETRAIARSPPTGERHIPPATRADRHHPSTTRYHTILVLAEITPSHSPSSAIYRSVQRTA
ncbi:hypothetical protein EVAR_66208_1 [Eumeta japonica]|uniref:Uncharacterized protein n=1 Tax=Eumeta variegata TaxID=151549 RepID=A0A4C1ZN10_EUMVA|nr:hypothetical protein EVAR_66208_1 [Eumeta japonica]